MLKHCAANRKRRISALPNVGPHIYDVKISGFTRSSINLNIYIYISRLRFKRHTHGIRCRSIVSSDLVSRYECGGSLGSVRLHSISKSNVNCRHQLVSTVSDRLSKPAESTVIKQQVRSGHVPSKPQWRVKRRRIEQCFSIRTDHW
jgi:hypothetical protein